MVYVPHGPGGASAAPFLIQESEVTNLDYAEWLDELSAEERASHRPSTGFVEDRETPGRLVVAAGLEDEPVVGIRADDATAYAAWRAETYGLRLRLPTPAEWRRAAGLHLLDAPHAAFFRPARPGAAGERARDRGPYGVRGCFTAPAEYVSGAEGYLVLGERGPWASALVPEALEVAIPVTPGQRERDVGFRLVQDVR
jgi:formylglycine-generating enzyme required for sulfatase activity